MYETHNAKGAEESVMAQSFCRISENVTFTVQFYKLTERKSYEACTIPNTTDDFLFIQNPNLRL